MSNPMIIPYDYSLTCLSVNRFTDLLDLLEINFIQYFPFLQTIGLYLPQPPPPLPEPLLMNVVPAMPLVSNR